MTSNPRTLTRRGAVSVQKLDVINSDVPLGPSCGPNHALKRQPERPGWAPDPHSGDKPLITLVSRLRPHSRSHGRARLFVDVQCARVHVVPEFQALRVRHRVLDAEQPRLLACFVGRRIDEHVEAWKRRQYDSQPSCRNLKARLHMRFLMRFRCDFDAILRTKPAPAYPARVFNHVTLRQNTAKLAEI